ncbi:ribonuclease E inhibitor RraB [Dyella humicola]|uniref:ribonuclease E inhibitor RraB n=1 Tax=Dyella humicola TaxID=2992126 RepID=UPI00225298FB|nr:ribonuclease E inhibitor RraB [Dyella humicola]
MKKSPILEKLLEVADGDTDTLRELDSNGDDFSIPREVEFMLLADSKESADNAADIINDFKYGTAEVLSEEGVYSVQVVIFMPVMQNVILSISGFMQCFAQSFGLKYDGWGCMVQKG